MVNLLICLRAAYNIILKYATIHAYHIYLHGLDKHDAR